MRQLRSRPFGNRENPTCKEVATVLQSYLDGELTVRDIPTIENHLEACLDCGMEAEIYRSIKTRLHARSQAIEPDVMDRLRAFASSITDGPGIPPPPNG